MSFSINGLYKKLWYVCNIYHDICFTWVFKVFRNLISTDIIDVLQDNDWKMLYRSKKSASDCSEIAQLSQHLPGGKDRWLLELVITWLLSELGGATRASENGRRLDWKTVVPFFVFESLFSSWINICRRLFIWKQPSSASTNRSVMRS